MTRYFPLIPPDELLSKLAPVNCKYELAKLIAPLLAVILTADFEVISKVPVPDEVVEEIAKFPLLVLTELPFMSKGL